jgi:type IV pilus assembly protein PilB
LTREASIAIPRSLADSIPAIGLRYEKDTLVVGIPETFTNKQVDDALDSIVNELDISAEAQLLNEDLIREIVSLSYQGLSSGNFEVPRDVSARSEVSIVELVNRLLEAAVRMRASDIHIEPFEKELLVRIRIDGRLEDLAHLPSDLGPAIISRLKVLARMSIVERRKPQDGQFNAQIGGNGIDIRLSTVATLFGEKAAMRLLDTRRNLGELTSLGMSEERLSNLKRIFKGGHGLIISAGPTGSGKTTTMHSALQIVNSPDLNVCTIEDPVEYVVNGINHIPVNEASGLTFATQLRAILRQDPDVVLVGEIRDAETARIAVQAALAGRLVLSTIHAPNALGAIYRLFQMGIEPYQVAASLVAVISQRLVRKNCPYCSELATVAAATRTYVQSVVKKTKISLMAGKGCTICRNTGYFDRIGAFQLFEINESIRELISQRPSPTQLENMSRKFGLLSLHEEALILAADGFTSIDEVLGLDSDYEE